MRYIYGPVSSARLGISLGVDIIPPKTCCYDCIYCQQGRTTEKTFKRREYIKAEEVISELKDYLSSYEGELDCVTLSGSGEPTLNSKIRDIIAELKNLTNVPIVVLTNGALLTDRDVQEALFAADVVVPTLTSVNKRTHKAIHRPATDVDIDGMIRAYTDFRRSFKGRFEVEVMVLRGYNDSDGEVNRLRDVLAGISPDKLQMNTIRRPPSEDVARSVPIERLREIGEALNLPFSLPERRAVGVTSERWRRQRILEMLSRRPVGLSELADATRMSPVLLSKLLSELIEEDIIARKRSGDGEFFVIRRRGDG